MQDRHLIRQQHNLYAHKMHTLSFIWSEVAKRMIDRLDYIKLLPERILDIGSGLGIDANLLTGRFPQATLLQLDNAYQLLHQVRYSQLAQHNTQYFICADALNLPCLNHSIDLLWSNLSLPYISNLEQYFSEIKRVLALNGCFLLTGLGPDSFKELRAVGLSTYKFPDMHTIGDILLKLGFSNPVTDVERITLEYDNVTSLLADIRLIGCGAALNSNKQAAKYLGQDSYCKLFDKFNECNKQKKLVLTLEIFYAHAWNDTPATTLADGRQIIQFQH